MGHGVERDETSSETGERGHQPAAGNWQQGDAVTGRDGDAAKKSLKP
jgi:hypothetical protein